MTKLITLLEEVCTILLLQLNSGEGYLNKNVYYSCYPKHTTISSESNVGNVFGFWF